MDNCDRLGPTALTHKDIHPWNLLTRDQRPVLLGWELSGNLDLAGEFGSTALGLAKGPGFDHLEPTTFRSVLDGYVNPGGEPSVQQRLDFEQVAQQLGNRRS